MGRGNESNIIVDHLCICWFFIRSCVHLQEDCIVHAALYGIFTCVYASILPGGRINLNLKYIIWMKLILKSGFCLLTLHNSITVHDTNNIKCTILYLLYVFCCLLRRFKLVTVKQIFPTMCCAKRDCVHTRNDKLKVLLTVHHRVSVKWNQRDALFTQFIKN
jgi:hypothetical protein